MVQWADFPWDTRMYTASDPAILTKAMAAAENSYANEAGGHSRYPGLVDFCSLPGNKVYLTKWRNDLIAATDQGRLFRIDRNGNAVDVTGVPISGGKRVIFAATENELVMAAGGPILALRDDRTELLSDQAPETTHVAYLNGYLLAIENGSARWYPSQPGDYREWDALDVFTANAKPDPLHALQVTPWGEILLAGEDSVEQWEPLPNGTRPFSRRWSTGEGVRHPYTLVADKTGAYGVNSRFEFVRFFGQVSQDQSDNIDLKAIDDWTDAWAQELATGGNKNIVIQAPYATNAYGTKGVTLLYDYRARKWSFLYGWDATLSAPARWPVWSTQRIWDDVFAGVPGGIARFSDRAYTLQGQPYPFLIRSGHVDKFGASRIDDVKIRIRRGVGAYNASREPQIGIRVNRDNLGFDKWQYESLGAPGHREMVIRFGGQGCADTWQFEIAVSDDVPVEFVGMQVHVERLSW